MKKFLSTFLAVTMALSALPTAFAKAERLEDWDSIKLPVVNEVQDANSEEAFVTQSVNMLSNNTASGGGGSSAGSGGSGGSGVVAAATYFTVNVPDQTASKDSYLVVKDFRQYVSNDDLNIFDEFLDYYNVEYYQNIAFAVFEKDGEKYIVNQSRGDTDNGGLTWGLLSNDKTTTPTYDLYIPVPAELDEGAYNVTFYQVPYAKSVIEGMSAKLKLTVTAADPTVTARYTMRDLYSFKKSVAAAMEGRVSDVTLELAEAVETDFDYSVDISGIAISSNGQAYPLEAYLEPSDSTIMINEWNKPLPMGSYTCYFFTGKRMFEEGDKLGNAMFGPLQLNVSAIAFANDCYPKYSNNGSYVRLEISESLAATLPEELDNPTVTLAVTDFNGNAVHTLKNIPLEDYWNDQWSASISFELDFIGFDVGSYNVKVTLNDTANVYDLGTAVLTVAENVMGDVYIMNYSNELTPQTEYFYVVVNMTNMFIDYDKINIEMVDREGNVVAETVSKELKSATSYNGSELMYKLEVTQPLTILDSYGAYTLDIQSDPSVNLGYTGGSYVSIRVTDSPCVVRAELVGSNTVKIYTENLPAGEYVVVRGYNDDEITYPIEIDDQGVGIFQWQNDNKNTTYHSFRLKTADNNEIDWFELRTEREYNYFSTTPEFLSPVMSNVSDFAVRVETVNDNPTAADIEYAKFLQNGEEIATLTNIKVDGRSFYSNGTVMARLIGDLVLNAGKSFTEKDAIFEIKYKDGFVSQGTIPVAGPTDGIYGYTELDNSCYYNTRVGNDWANMAVGSNRAKFIISDTNLTSGKVRLYDYENYNSTLEEIDLANLQKTTKYGYSHTYVVDFATALSSDKVYCIELSANGQSTGSSSFTYYPGKLTEQNDDLIVAGNSANIYLYDWINISNIQGLTFKAVSNGVEYNVPVTVDYAEENYINFTGNFSAVPTGYFTLKAYDGGVEVVMAGRTKGYNYGNISTPIVVNTGWHWENNDTRLYSIYGINLDKVNNAVVKLYKIVDFPEDSNGEPTKLKYVKDIELPKPYTSTRISIPNAELADLETGTYAIVYVVDGKAVEADEITIKGTEPQYKASILLNGGLTFTNKTEVDMTISYSGYTKMKVALSEAALADVAYEAISTHKTVSLEGLNGAVTVYVQFANEDESKEETLSATITVDSIAPTISDVDIPTSISLWNSKNITFVSNESLKNAFLAIGEVNAETGLVEGKTYVFTFKSLEDGKYTYTCNLYAGNQYQDNSDMKVQIVAVDKAGNKAIGEVANLHISQPRSISGTVTYNGSAVTNAYVYLYGENGQYAGYAYINKDGTYTFYGVTEGNYTIVVEKYGYESASLTVQSSEFTADITGKDFVLESIYAQNAAITVNVKDAAAAPVENAYVEVYSWDTGIRLTARTAADGTAVITVPYAVGGTYYNVYANYEDYSLSQGVVVDAAKSVDFALPKKATITGVVKSGDVIIKNAEIYVTGDEYSTYAVTDENGAYTATVYITDTAKTFTVSTAVDAAYSGSTEVTFEEGVYEATADLELKGNIRVKGTIKDKMGNPVKSFTTIYFNAVDSYNYTYVSVDENGEFETASVLGAGKYRVTSYGWPYKDINEEIEITEEDLDNPIKELNIVAEKYYTETLFQSGYNGISASTDTIAKGDKVTVSVKFQNDGTATLNDVKAFAELPAGLTVTDHNGAIADNVVSKTVAALKADEKGSLTFTIDTSAYEGETILIPAYVTVGSRKYLLGSVVINLVTASLTAPQVVKADTAFKVSGEAVSGSLVEIMNYNTKEVLASTTLTSKWYFADITLSETATLIAKATKDGKTGYSEPVEVVVEANPIEVEDIKITNNAYEYASNEFLGYPTFSASVGGDLTGWDIGIAVKFKNMPADATVKYSFANVTDVPGTKDASDYYNATIRRWKGSGTKKIYATVTDGDKEYVFIIAEVIILIDPSGYITDAETGEPVEGATVLIEEYVDGAWRTWDAQPHKQQNPMLTNAEGHYGWDVPEGKYRITVEKDGYTTKTIDRYDSRDYGDNSEITVLPVRTDVDIQIEYARPVELDATAIKTVAGSKVKFVFTRPVDATTVTTENLQVVDSSNNPVAGTLGVSENNKTVVFIPAEPMANGDYTIVVKDIKDTKGNVIAAENVPFEKTAEVAALAAPTAAYNSTDGTIEITFADEPVNADEIKVMAGSTAVSGTLRQQGNVVTFIPDVAFTAGTSYKVVVSDMLRTAADNYLDKAFEANVTTPGGGGGSSSGSGGGGGASSTTSYKITVTQAENGKITPDTVTVESGESKSFVIVPAAGYEIEDVIVDGKSVGAVSTYTFEKVTANATITAKFKKTTTAWTNSFTDVNTNDWFYKAVEFASQRGFTSGVSDTSFAPSNKVTRGQFITMLCRAYGVEPKTGDNFADCGDTWYTGYLAAAKQLGISNGVGDNMFAPEKEITREEMVTLIYNYLKSNGEAMEEKTTTSFADDAEISEWAKAAVAYASEEGIVAGKGDNKFAPKDNATRAELVQIFYGLFN